MQFNKNTSSGKTNIIGLIIKSIIGLVVILGLVFLINKIDFPAPKKEIEKTSARITASPRIDLMIMPIILDPPKLVFLLNCI